MGLRWFRILSPRVDRHLVLLHGLSGVGKTTVCEALGEATDTAYLSVAGSPDFRQKPMWQICANLAMESDRSKRVLLTEACLLQRSGRDRYVSKVMERCREQGLHIDQALIIYLREDDLAFISGRRGQSPDYDEPLKAKIETGSDNFDYWIYVSSPDERECVRERSRRMRLLIDEWLRRVVGRADSI